MCHDVEKQRKEMSGGAWLQLHKEQTQVWKLYLFSSRFCTCGIPTSMLVKGKGLKCWVCMRLRSFCLPVLSASDGKLQTTKFKSQKDPIKAKEPRKFYMNEKGYKICSSVVD